MTPNQPDNSALSIALRGAFGANCRITSRTALPAQASNRSYVRFHLEGFEVPETVIVMVLPDDPFSSEESGGDSDQAQLPFVILQEFFAQRGVPVPKLYADHTRDGFLLLEDLGERTMLDQVKRDIAVKNDALVEYQYEQAVELLVEFQEATEAPADNMAYTREFQDSLFAAELHEFEEFLLGIWAGVTLTNSQKNRLHKQFDGIVTSLREVPYRLAHRDFQSTNLLPRDSSYAIIDFQDALMAPPVYDLVALLRDSYVQLPPELVENLARRFYMSRSCDLNLSSGDFLELFHLQTLQRKLKDAGRFVSIRERKGNDRFMQYVIPTLGYVQNALEHLPRFESLHEIIAPALQKR